MDDNQLIETRLKVLTWNIWWQFGPWQQRQPAIAATLKNINADIIALQEVWSDETTSQAAILADELGYHFAFAPSKEAGESVHDNYYAKEICLGNAVLSRWPITRHASIPLYGRKETGESRVALFAEIDGPRGVIPAFSAHLNWRFDHSAYRQKQVVDLAKLIRDSGPWDYPPVVCGDFNAEPTAEEIRMLRGLTTSTVDGLFFHDAWLVAGGQGDGCTWNNTNPYAAALLEPDRRIDYVFVGPPGAHGAGHIVECNMTATDPIDGVMPSDHYAVMAELRY